MEMLIAARVKTLEDGLVKLQTELDQIKAEMGKSAQEDQTIPEGFITLSDFCKKYKFISGPGITTLIAESPELWEKFVKRVGRNVYIWPLYVIEYLLNPPSGVQTHVKIYNQLMKWHKIDPSLDELWDSWKIWSTNNLSSRALPDTWGEVNGLKF